MEYSKENTYWIHSGEELISELGSSFEGLESDEAKKRLIDLGPNILKFHRHDFALKSMFRQFTNPLVLILVFAAIVSSFAGEWTDSIIITLIILGSTILSFSQEYRASKAVEALRNKIKTKSLVLRDGKPVEILSEELVVGDIVILSAGSLIPADCILIESNDFFVNQAIITGEAYPVEKRACKSGLDSDLAERSNMIYMGTNVRSGTAKAIIVTVGKNTEFGMIAEKLNLEPPETEFERGIKEFGQMLTKIMTVLVLIVLVINILLEKPPIESILFAVALAVGLTPELLPAIISISLSKGAQDMAQNGVIVRRLSAIDNLGSMNILCTDKTGTLTEGAIRLEGAYDANGSQSEQVMRYAYLNAVFQTGIKNLLDDAIMAHPHLDITGMDKLFEIPYDFIRKRLSLVVDSDPGSDIKPLLITKGALENVLSVCSTVGIDGEINEISSNHLENIYGKYEKWSLEGYRVLGIAVRAVSREVDYSIEHEKEMTFLGFLLFFDPPKTDVGSTIEELSKLGVSVKIITGDNHLVAKHVAEQVGISAGGIITSKEIKNLSEEALWNIVQRTSVFAEVDPNQKERIILALKKSGNVVGYMGDGINDAPALHAADIGISVDNAVDVAKEAADFVLLKHDLKVLLAGIKEGRRTFANSLKYIFTTTSANFGNMISMAGASLFLPFLPLLAKQILLNNFLSDFPAIGIPSDNVDDELTQRPHKWNIRFITRFMVVFGMVSSVFDYVTFALLIYVLKASEQQFRSGWFVESLLTELIIAIIVRTRRPFYRSKPGKILAIITTLVVIVTILFPYIPVSIYMGFTPLPIWFMLVLIILAALYILVVEIAKKIFYKHVSL